MTSSEAPTGKLSDSLSELKQKDKAPASARVLDNWINQAQKTLKTGGPRLGWLVAATVVTAALQKAVDGQGSPLFLLKGGTMLQYRLNAMSRTTKDVDGLVRGEIGQFLIKVDEVLAKPWGPFTLERDKVEIIDVPSRIIKPRRFDIKVMIKGITWRKIQIEIAADEGDAGESGEMIPAPTLAGFGIPSPDSLAVLSLRYQIAQKIHAATDPHNPPEVVNDRARDLVDLILLQDLLADSGKPSAEEIGYAVDDIFRTRAKEAAFSGTSPRYWPAQFTAHADWSTSYSKAAEDAGVSETMQESVDRLNAWLEEVGQFISGT